MLVRLHTWLDSLPYPLAVVIHRTLFFPMAVWLFVLHFVAPATADEECEALDVHWTKKEARRSAEACRILKIVEARALETKKLQSQFRALADGAEDEDLKNYLREQVEVLRASEREDWEMVDELRQA